LTIFQSTAFTQQSETKTRNGRKRGMLQMWQGRPLVSVHRK